jgi:hypothetical protein
MYKSSVGVEDHDQESNSHDPGDEIMATATAKPATVREHPTTSRNLGAGHPAAIGWREEMVRRIAYRRSQRRPPCSGKETEDWLAAEREVDELIACGGAPYR